MLPNKIYVIGSILQNLPNESVQYNLHNRDLVPYTYSNSVTSILSRLHTYVEPHELLYL